MTAASARDSMNRMYRYTRHIYDASRKYYLLGRDVLISNLNPSPGDHICEIGCGTARNLIKLTKKYPEAQFYGIDASDEMLKTAWRALGHRNLKIPLAQGFAESFDPRALFAVDAFDKIFFSYSLSIIPPWREAIGHTLEVVKSRGEIHIIDFGPQNELPPMFRKGLYWWLDKFHVHYQPELLPYLKNLETQGKGKIETFRYLDKGYAQLIVFRKS